MKIELTESEIGAILYLCGIEIGRLRSIETNNDADENVGNNEINFYKELAFKLNKTISY